MAPHDDGPTPLGTSTCVVVPGSPLLVPGVAGRRDAAGTEVLAARQATLAALGAALRPPPGSTATHPGDGVTVHVVPGAVTTVLPATVAAALSGPARTTTPAAALRGLGALAVNPRWVPWAEGLVPDRPAAQDQAPTAAWTPDVAVTVALLALAAAGWRGSVVVHGQVPRQEVGASGASGATCSTVIVDQAVDQTVDQTVDQAVGQVGVQVGAPRGEERAC